MSAPAARRLLFVHFAGLGNGVTMLPILRRLEEVAPGVGYFHTANPVFEAKELVRWMRLDGFLGEVPPLWRRFDTGDAGAIRSFLSTNGVDVVVNLRNEGPRRDVGYARFKASTNGSGPAFWDLEELGNGNGHAARAPRRIVTDQLALLSRHGFDLSEHRADWLREFVDDTGRARARGGEIGLFTGVSQSVKRWPASQWIALGERLLFETGRDVVVYAGLAEDEDRLAREVAEALVERFGAARVSLVAKTGLLDLVGHLAGLDAVVSNDTSCIHLAAALGLPAVGLYFATVAAIWGGMSDRFTAVESATGLACPDLKPDAGNCNYYYGGCPAPCQADVTPGRVFAAVARALARIDGRFDAAALPGAAAGAAGP